MLLDGECINFGIVPGVSLRVLVGRKIRKDEPREAPHLRADGIETELEIAPVRRKEGHKKHSTICPKKKRYWIDEADRNFEEQMKENEERQRRQGEETSFAEEVPEESKGEEQAQEEDLSMFERDLTLPDEGAMCIDTNIHAAKYLMVQLMNRINKDMKTFWKFNIATDRKGKLANWEKGFRPDLTGKEYPQSKKIDPVTGEPKALSELE